MENYILANDVKILCVTAKSFPNGVQEAYNILDQKLADSKGRTYYGISYANKDQIIYKAAVAESYIGEGEKLGCEEMTIQKGAYLVETILKWKENMDAFGATFQKLLATPRLDKKSFCVEWYKSDEEVMCMVKLME